MAQIDVQTKTIGSDTYKVNMLDPLLASDLMLDLAEVFGPAVAALGSSVLKSSDSKEALSQILDGTKSADLLGDNLERGLNELITKLDKTKQREIISLLSSVTSVRKGDNWPPLDSIFVVHFRGRIKAMYQWLAFAVRTQYADFF